ncbi:MAG: DUF4239 domain-containing protein [Williamsia sp.]|nr:DUF4239 domain-containing protein [Williamsia sp.]
MYFKLYISAGIWGVVLISILIIVAHAGLFVFDKWWISKRPNYNNEVAGIVFGVLSLIYSLLVAFVIVAVWENYEDLKRTIENETDHLNSVLVHSNMLPDSLRAPVAAAIKNYCSEVVNQEWDMRAEESYRQSAIPSLRFLLFQAHTDSKIQESLLSVMDENLSSITSLRRERLSHTRSYVPDMVWTILIISSLMIVLFSYFLWVEPEQLKRIYLSFLWAIIGMSMFLIYMLDHPFIGSTQVSRGPYEAIIKTLNTQ